MRRIVFFILNLLVFTFLGAQTLTTPWADKVDRDWNDTEYVYYSNEHRMKLEFKVVDNIIVKISCEIDD